MTHEWYEAAGGLGLQIAEPPAEEIYAGIIRTKSKNKYEIERWDGAGPQGQFAGARDRRSPHGRNLPAHQVRRHGA